MGKKKEVETVMVTVRLPKEMVRVLKMNAADQGRTIQEVVRMALMKHLLVPSQLVRRVRLLEDK